MRLSSYDQWRPLPAVKPNKGQLIQILHHDGARVCGVRFGRFERMTRLDGDPCIVTRTRAGEEVHEDATHWRPFKLPRCYAEAVR